MPDGRIHPLRTAALARLPSGVLVWSGAAFTAAFVCERFSPVDASTLLMMLLPLLWLAATPAVRLRDGLLERFLVLAFAWQAWMAIVQSCAPATLPAGWWRVAEHAAALAACLLLAIMRDDPRQQLRILGTSAAAASLLALGVGAYGGLLGPLQTACFGFGHINILMNTAGPSLLAWAVLCAHDRAAGRRMARLDLVVLACGLACLLTLALATGRRGVPLAYGAAGAWLLWRWLFRRRARIALALAALMVGAAFALAWWMLSAEVAVGRFERIGIYRAAWEGIKASFPLGYGYYGSLHLQWLDGEHARRLTASGGWGTHTHNELLDTLLDGGPVALLLVLGMLAALALRIERMRDAGLRTAWQAAAAAIVVHLLTDNCYGTTLGLVWAGVVAGAIFAAPTTTFPPVTGHLPRARLLMWPLALVSAWGATRTIYPAVLDKDADLAVRVQCLAQALEPQTVDLHARTIFAESWADLAGEGQRQVMATTVTKIGWTGTLAVMDAQRALAAGTPRERLTAFLRVLGFAPFDKGTYEQVAHALVLAPDLASEVPPAVLARLAYISGRRDLPLPNLESEVATIDAAIDLHAAIRWAVVVGRPWSDIREPLQRLVHRYGTIPGVALLALQCAAEAPTGTFPDLPRESGTLLFGLRYADAEATAVLEKACGPGNPGSAGALQPLLLALWPDIIRECEQGVGPRPQQAESGLRLAIVRLWGRLHAR